MDFATVSYLGPLAGIVALAFAAYLASTILSKSRGNARMQEIQGAVREGAFAFLKVEYQVVAIFAAILTIVFAGVGVATGKAFWYFTAGGFVIGALLSALAGYIGMWISVSSNARVAEAARGGIKPALALSFRAGAVNGFAVVGLGIIGLGGLYISFQRVFGLTVQETPLNLIGFAFGASLITLFARIAGGIYTKAADVGADLVGKVEAGIPEDDPRNPAVIADNVGDNVGDCAGMGADLFETYVVTLVAAMTLAATAGVFAAYGEAGILFPLTLGAFAIVASIVGIFFVRLPKNENIMNALYMGVIATCCVSAIGFALVWAYVFPTIHVNFLFAAIIGLILTLALVFVTDYFTSQGYAPVKGIVDASTTGPATNIIQGLAVGLQSVFIPVLFVVAGIISSYMLGNAAGAGLGLYGVAMAAVGMLSVAGMVVALDTYGPITDNAGGVAEMSELPPDVRKVTDALDAVGNTTKATTKGYAIGSAALAALVLFADFVDHANESAHAAALLDASKSIVFEVSNPFVLSGLLLGAAIVFLFSSYAMAAVGRAAHAVVNEVRRQFADGQIMAGKRKPDYQTCVAIVTKAALKEMVVPGSLAVAAPIVVGFVLGPLALGGMIMGTIVGGFALALLMSNAGGAWDNAKKSFESGVHGGKGSPAHKAAVVGDTVGDPFKDTAGPAINPLIKAMTTISVIIAGLVVTYSFVGI
ncbi:MAG TPA: sodium-translocating pyrophosphatase [Candidatus Thermoplasmatota archaeon]|nr:sodium-translocating pyrophosphatase [Candidatus Thermoplasmatota archaeon]